MDGFRPLMAPPMQGQFCPVCRLPHFPFCHPAAMNYPHYAPPYSLPPPRFEPPTRSNYAFPQELPPNSTFAARHPSGEMLPPASSHYHSLPAMHPHLPPESSLGSAARIDYPGFPPGGHLEMGREREQQFYQQQNQAAAMVDRFRHPSLEEHAAGKVPRVNDAADSAFARKQHFEPSLQDGHQQPHGSNLPAGQFMPSWRGPENGLDQGFPKDRFGQDGSWGPTSGFSKSAFEVSESINHSSRGNMPWDYQGQAESQESRHGIAGRPYPLSDRHHPLANLDVSRVFDSHPYPSTVAKSTREQNWNGPRDEKLVVDHDLEASKVKEEVLRQQEMFMQQGLQLKGSERVGAMRMQEESVTRPAAQRKSSKRKRNMTDISLKQPMSREEELLIEQGLLDDDSTSSESDSVLEHTKQKQGVTSVGSKQVAPQEESVLPLKSMLTAKEQASEFGLQKKQGIAGDIKQGAADMYSMGRFPRNSDGWTSSWSLETHTKNKDHPGQFPFDGISRNGIEKGPTGEAFYARSWHPTHSVQVAEMHPPSNGAKMDLSEGTTQQKDKVLQQYQEWEAEQCHMEALKRAEEMAREIRQRDEHVLKTGSSHPVPSQDVPLQRQFSKEHRNFNQSHLEPAPRYQSSQLKNEEQELVLDHLKAKSWHPSPAVQHFNASSHQSFVHESHMYEQQDTRRQANSLQHDSQPSSVMHKASHLSQHSMYTSESSLQQHVKSSGDELHEWSRQSDIHGVHAHQGALGQRLSLPNAQSQMTQVAPENLQPRLSEQQKWQQEHVSHPQDPKKWNLPEQHQSQPQNSGEHQHHISNQNWQSTGAPFGQCYGSGVGNEGTQYTSGRHQEPYRSFPPLPNTDPLMPNSPPPPPPSGPPPPLDMQPPAPPAFSSIVSAGVVAGHPRTFYTEGLKAQNIQNQNSQSLDTRQQEQQSLHLSGVPVISQSSVGLAGNQHPQISSAPSKQSEKSKVDAVNIFRNPGRLTRPDQFVVILRGLPGSGKSYLAKALRDVEVMNGGNAPRIHSMDDYFMAEVEKTEDDATGASSLRGRKKIVKRVMEYCFEPEMEEVYRASMLKAFRKTLEEGMFNFVIVDDRNVLVADFAQFWATAKRSGYEVYILEAGYNDVAGCGARNVHSFTVEQIQSMADRWEPTPPLYLQLDVSSLFRGDDLNSQDIIEVEMDADDMERDLEEEEEKSQLSQEQIFQKDYHTDKEKPILGEKWEDKTEPSGDRDMPKSTRRAEDKRIERNKEGRDTSNALSGLMSTYGKKDKFVHWADNQGVKGGYSIGHKNAPLVIGPGPGYNAMSNPTLEEMDKNQLGTDSRRKTRFIEQLRAEQETFKAAFARRRQRIGGMEDEEDD